MHWEIDFKGWVGQGSFGVVYDVLSSSGDALVAKFSRDITGMILNDGDSREYLAHEFGVQCGLYGEILVPRPIDFCDVSCFGGKYPAIIMQKILGATRDYDLQEFGCEMSEGEKCYRLDRARELGYVPGSDFCAGNNILWSSNDSDFYFIDFGEWVEI